MPTRAVPQLLQHVRRLAAESSSDERLLADFLATRSEDAFAALLGRHGPMVLSICRRVLHDAHAAEDVFQATFLVLVDRAAAVRRRASLAGFLHGVAYRLAVRARRRGARPLPEAVSDGAEGPADGLAWKEMLAVLDDELGRLPDRLRAPLVLCYLEGRTQDEAARQLGWGLNTLRRRLAEGRGLLEARLRGRGVTLPAALAGVLAAGAAAVPAPLRAATLAAAEARSFEGLTAGASALVAARGGVALFLSASSKKLGALLVGTALGAACLGYWAMQSDQPPASAPPAAADPLPAGGAVRLGTARYRYGNRIESFAVSADGRLAAASSGSGLFTGVLSPARVFDLTDGRCVYSLPDEGGPNAEAVGLSPDGKTLAVKDDTFLTFRDAATGKELRRLKYTSNAGGGRSITDWMTFTPDGKHVAVTLMGDATQLVEVESGKVVRAFAAGAAGSACVFSPDGKVMATGGYDTVDQVYHVRVWDVGTGKELRRFPAARFPGPANGVKRALAFSPDGSLLAGGGWGDARLRLWDTATGKEPVDFPKTGDEVVSVAFAPDGKTVAAASDQVYLYDSATGKERFRIDRRARGLAFSRDGSVLTGAVSGAIYRWDAAGGRQLTPAGQDSAVEQILVGPDGKSLFTTDQDGNLHAWDATGGKPPRRIAGGAGRGVVASPDRRFLAWAARVEHGNSRVRLYDVEAGRVLDPVLRGINGFTEIGGEATVAAFLPGGKSLLTLEGHSEWTTLRLWDLTSGKERRSFTVAPPKSVGESGGRLTPMIPFCTPRRVALSPDGKALAVGPDFPEGATGVPVRLWDVATGRPGVELQEPAELPGGPDEAAPGARDRLGRGARWHMKSRDGRAFSPDGRLLVDWAERPFGRGRTDHVHVWDAATGRAVATLAAGPRNGAANAAFAPDGRTLATASADGVIRLWETATWTVRAEFRGHRDRVTAVAFGPDGRLFTGGLDTVVLGWDTRPRAEPKGTLAEAWEALAGPDAKAGFAAQGRFLAEPAQAAEWFAARLTPAVGPDPGRVKALIADLDKDYFATRERATAGLKEHWPDTEPALREVAAKSPSVEARRRAERLLREMAKAVTPPGRLCELRAAEVLEWVGTKEASDLLGKLATGAPGARLTREAAAAWRRLEGRK